VRYSQGEARVEPVYSLSEDPPQEQRRDFLQLNLDVGSRQAADLLLSCGFFGHETREMLAAVIERWMLEPNSFHASTWFDETHGEGFGTTTDSVHYTKNSPAQVLFGQTTLAQIQASASRSLWPDGYLEWAPVRRLFR